jgi:hypothetical protein
MKKKLIFLFYEFIFLLIVEIYIKIVTVFFGCQMTKKNWKTNGIGNFIRVPYQFI